MQHHGRGHVFQQATLYRLGLHDIRSTCNMRYTQKHLHTIYCLLYNTQCRCLFGLGLLLMQSPRERFDYTKTGKKKGISIPATWFHWEKPASLQLIILQRISLAAWQYSFLMIWAENIVMQPENSFFPSSSSAITLTFYSVRSPACA